MANMKRFAEKVSVEMGMKGEICSAVHQKAQALIEKRKKGKKYEKD